MNAAAIAGSLAVLLLAGCASVPPSGPAVMVLPGTGKSFDLFRSDDLDCRQYANSQLGGSTLQQRYDAGYLQCMYARGHKIPATSRLENTGLPVTSTTPPPPPPPAGTPPPPPPGVK